MTLMAIAIFIFVFMYASYTDIKEYEIPVKWVNLATSIILLLFFLDYIKYGSGFLLNGLLGAAIGYAVSFVLFIKDTDQFGYGDVVLIRMIGALLGVQSMFVIITIAAICGIIIIKVSCRPRIPFGPVLFGSSIFYFIIFL